MGEICAMRFFAIYLPVPVEQVTIGEEKARDSLERNIDTGK